MRIKIKKNFLIFREEAKNLEGIAKRKLRHSNSVSFDFSNVKFLSRSFADELLNTLSQEKRIKIINLSPDLQKFLKIIKKTKETLCQIP